METKFFVSLRSIQSQHEVYLGACWRHVRLNHQRNQPDEIASNSTNNLGSSRFLIFSFPEFRILKVLVAQRRNIHGDLQSLFYFDPLQFFYVLLIFILCLLQKFQVFFDKLFGRYFGNLFGIVAVSEFQNSMDQIPQIGKEFVVIFLDEIAPWKLGVRFFRPVVEQIVPPDFTRDPSFRSRISKDSSSVSFREFSSFIIQVLRGRNMMKHGPVLSVSD